MRRFGGAGSFVGDQRQHGAETQASYLAGMAGLVVAQFIAVASA